jgi:hypothetical protein
VTYPGSSTYPGSTTYPGSDSSLDALGETYVYTPQDSHGTPPAQPTPGVVDTSTSTRFPPQTQPSPYPNSVPYSDGTSTAWYVDTSLSRPQSAQTAALLNQPWTYVGQLGALPVSWAVDNMLFGATDDQGCTWYVKKSDGWFGPPKPKTQRTAKFQTQGSFRSLAPRGERIIALTGTTKCPDVVTRLDALDRFAAMASDPAQVYTLIVDDQRGYPRTIGVELDANTQVSLAGATWFDWQIQFGCPDPRKHDATWQQPACGATFDSSAGLDFSGGGLDFSGNGLDFGSVGGGSSAATVTNFGSTTAFPVLQLAGPCQNPTITDVSTGLTLSYAGSLNQGDVLTINCDDFSALGFPSKSCYVNDTQNHRSQLALSGLWPQVGAGEVHSFSFAAGGTNAYSALTVWLRAAWY